jgi:hypothetical protein
MLRRELLTLRDPDFPAFGQPFHDMDQDLPGFSGVNRPLRHGWRARSHLYNQGEPTTAQYIQQVKAVVDFGLRVSANSSPGRSPECVSVAVDRAIAHDLSRIVDRFSSLQIPTRVRGDEGVEVYRRLVVPDEGA